MLPETIDCVMINTGNLITSKELKKKATQTPSEEVLDGLCGAFHTWLNSVQMESPAEITSVSCISPNIVKVDPADRTQLKVSVKIFLENYSCEDLKISILQAMDALEVQVIDSLILALPCPSETEKFNLEVVKPLWSELQNFVNNEKVVTIGISDLDTPDLADLYKWTQIKPSVNQVNLESCCVMPPEMIAFARENDIQLLTHNDSKVLLPSHMLNKVLEPAVASPDDWRISWIVRYSVVVKCRGIIQNKGYLLQVQKKT